MEIYYDTEGDYLEIIFYRGEGYFCETSDDRIMGKVDNEGNVLGFSVMSVSSLNVRS